MPSLFILLEFELYVVRVIFRVVGFLQVLFDIVRKRFYEPVFSGGIVFDIDFNVYVIALNGDIKSIFSFTLAVILIGELIAIAKFRHVRSLFAFDAAWIVNNTFYGIVVNDAELSTVDDQS